jgi:hypothetical protein
MNRYKSIFKEAQKIVFDFDLKSDFLVNNKTVGYLASKIKSGVIGNKQQLFDFIIGNSNYSKKDLKNIEHILNKVYDFSEDNPYVRRNAKMICNLLDPNSQYGNSTIKSMRPNF